jgi:hypothetical protein
MPVVALLLKYTTASSAGPVPAAKLRRTSGSALAVRWKVGLA